MPINEEEEEKRILEKYTLRPTGITIRALKSMGIEVERYLSPELREKYPEFCNWESLINLCNAMVIKGGTIDEDTPIKEFQVILKEVMNRGF